MIGVPVLLELMGGAVLIIVARGKNLELKWARTIVSDEICLGWWGYQEQKHYVNWRVE